MCTLTFYYLRYVVYDVNNSCPSHMQCTEIHDFGTNNIQWVDCFFLLLFHKFIYYVVRFTAFHITCVQINFFKLLKNFLHYISFLYIEKKSSKHRILLLLNFPELRTSIIRVVCSFLFYIHTRILLVLSLERQIQTEKLFITFNIR